MGQTMRNYLITILMRDGSRGRCLFESEWHAIDCALSTFFEARRISARRVS